MLPRPFCQETLQYDDQALLIRDGMVDGPVKNTHDAPRHQWCTVALCAAQDRAIVLLDRAAKDEPRSWELFCSIYFFTYDSAAMTDEPVGRQRCNGRWIHRIDRCQ